MALKYNDDILKSLNFGKELDSQALSEANNDANSIKHHEEKITELQSENKQLKDENRTLSEIIKVCVCYFLSIFIFSPTL